MRWWIPLLLSGTLLLQSSLAGATVFQPRDFASPEDESRYKALIAELRCLVCQNQSLADSNAELATDLRKEVYKMIDGGSSDDEIVDFMVARYGDFVLYRPPIKPATLLLWSGPFILVVLALVFLGAQIRRRATEGTSEPELTNDERQKVAELLGDDPNRKDI